MPQTSRITPKWADFSVGVGLLLATGLIDYLTGYKITVLAFYLVPTLLVLRRVGQTAAFVMSLLCGGTWLLADIAAGDPDDNYLTLAWNTSIRVSIFLLVVTLASARKDLENIVEQRSENLRAQVEECRRLEQDLLAASEREQQRIGHDLHDSLGQHLTATAMAGKLLAKKLAGKDLPEKNAADQLVRLIEDGIELTRKLARSLHPMELTAEGFMGSLQELCLNISLAFNVACTFECAPGLVLNDPDINIHIYRITQESISNAIRHGHARNIVVRLERAGAAARLTITDDGAGLLPDAPAGKGMGLRIINYRANMIGGAFEIARLPAGGTRVSCALPPDKTNSNDDEK